MSVVIRALLLLMPLVAFAVFGLFHGQHISQLTPGVSQVAPHPSAHLPPVASWAKATLPEFSGYSDTTEKKAAFFSFLYPRIVLANSRILLERQYMLSLEQKPQLTDEELRWLADQSDQLGINEEPGSDEMFSALTRKLDAVPPSLILAQAANESAWGTSRFARDGNNLFGQWCFNRGCGLVPLSRSPGAFHEVRKFNSPFDSISAYIRNLNRHNSYRELRHIRQQSRDRGSFASGASLAQGLSRYSERGEAYVKEIQNMIHSNNLGYYDRQFDSIVQNRSSDTLRLIASSNNEQQVSDYATPHPEGNNEG